MIYNCDKMYVVLQLIHCLVSKRCLVLAEVVSTEVRVEMVSL